MIRQAIRRAISCWAVIVRFRRVQPDAFRETCPRNADLWWVNHHPPRAWLGRDGDRL